MRTKRDRAAFFLTWGADEKMDMTRNGGEMREIMKHAENLLWSLNLEINVNIYLPCGIPCYSRNNNDRHVNNSRLSDSGA
jgi:hypothetical protein